MIRIQVKFCIICSFEWEIVLSELVNPMTDGLRYLINYAGSGAASANDDAIDSQ